MPNDRHHDHERPQPVEVTINVNFHSVPVIHVRLEGMQQDDPRLDQIITLIQLTGANVMTAITDFAAKQNDHNDKIDVAVTGLTADVDDLKVQIAALQASAGTISAEDQTLLDGIESRAQGIADKLTALDAQTPPTVPAG